MTLIAVSTLLVFGIIICAIMIPNEGSGMYLTSFGPQETRSLSNKILDWLPHHYHQGSHVEVEDSSPDWDQEFWSPIDIDVTNDPVVTLCRLNWKQYSQSPHLYPMFRDLVEISPIHMKIIFYIINRKAFRRAREAGSGRKN